MVKIIIATIILLAAISCNPANYTRATLMKDNGRVVTKKMKKTKCARLQAKMHKRLRKPPRPVNYGIN